MSEKAPTVSVIIPTFNRADLVKPTLDSVCRQTYSQWEAVVVDDGSSDATNTILAEYQQRESKIRILKRDRLPKGACTCRNIGLEAARGDYVVFLDSDDLLAPICLAQRMKAFRENAEADFIVFQGLFFRERLDDLRLLLNKENDESDLCRFLRTDSVWSITGPIWKKVAVVKLAGFDERLSCLQEIDLHQRALMQRSNHIKRLNDVPDYYVRFHRKGSISQDGFKSRETVGSVFRIYEKSVRSCGALADPQIRINLRRMLAFGVLSALDNRYHDLARAGIGAGKRDHLLNSTQWAIWKLAYLSYTAHSRGFRGCARLGKKLMAPFQPQCSIGTLHYSGPLAFG